MRLTGSGFARAEACPASTFLPGVEEGPSQYAKLGEAVHRYLCLVAEVGAESALALIDEEFRDVCKVLDLDGLPHGTPEGWAFEVAFAWDPRADTARELYRGSGERDYSAAVDGEVPGTADLVGLDGNTVIVLDLKTGWRPLGDPKTSLQLGFYAVAAARAYGASSALVGYIRLADGVPRYEHASLDEFELEAMAERLQAVLTAAQDAEIEHDATGKVTPVMGAHCVYCPAYLRCPAKATLARELAAQAVSTDPAQLTPVLDAASVPQALERLWLAQEVLKRVEKTLEEYAMAHPVTLPDGRVYGPIEQSTETFDPVLGREALAKQFGEEVADAAVEVKSTLTKASIARVLKEKALKPGEKFAPLERSAHDAIRAAGASRVSTYTTVKVFKPKRLTS